LIPGILQTVNYQIHRDQIISLSKGIPSYAANSELTCSFPRPIEEIARRFRMIPNHSPSRTPNCKQRGD
jgi:hypothetical protein